MLSDTGAELWDVSSGDCHKTAILTELRATGGYVSGEQLSRQLGTGRNAVWKQVAALRREGYKIEGATRRGYRLLRAPDRPLPWEVAHGLRTHTLGQRVVYLHTTTSTNDVARQLARRGAPEGILVVAGAQTSGRGRRGHSWESPAEQGLWMSLLLRPRLTPAEAPRLTLLTAVAVARAIQSETGLESLVKWPNDIVITDRKAGGILLEMSAESEVIHFLVAGVGLNTNVDMEALPEAVRDTTTSLKRETGRRVAVVPLLQRILAELEVRYDALLAGREEPLMDEVRSLSATLGREIRVIGDRSEVRGEAVAIEGDGALRVRDGEGGEHLFYAGEVSVRAL